MTVLKGPTRKRGAKAIAPEDVPSSEVRGDLLDNEVLFDVSTKPDPAGEQRNMLVAKSPAERAIVALNSTKAETQLRELVTKSADIVAVNSVDGREQAHRIAMTLKTTRVAIEKTGKAAREDAQAFSKAVITEENRLIAIISDEEKRVFKLRDEYDAEQARLKEEADRLARERVASIRAKIDAIAHLPSTLGGADSARLVEELQKLVAMQPTAEEFDGMLAEMLLTIETVGSALSALLDGARKREDAERQRIAEQEAERALLAAQAEENARIAAELERKRLEAEAAAKAQAEAIARERAEQQRQMDALRAEQEKQTRVMADIAKFQQAAMLVGDAREIDAALERLTTTIIDEQSYGMMTVMARTARDMAMMALNARMQLLVDAAYMDAYEELLAMSVPEPAAALPVESPAVHVTLVRTDDDHSPQFDWNTPAEQLEASAITPPAVEPAIDFAALDEPEAAHTEAADTFSYHLGQFFDAVRIMRQTRTADEVRKHLEVALADVQAEIAQGARGYK